LQNVDNLIVWGAGECSKWLFNACPELIKKVSYFVDNDDRIFQFGIKQILLPNKINDNYPILILSLAHENEIKQQIEQMGLTNEVITL
jgi:hypothetical protein